MPSVGATFAHYRIEAVLGKGGMGQVYLAFDERLHRQVALKVLLTSEPADAQRMVREARAAAAVEHPNKVTIYELGEAEGAPYIAMELIRGPTLRALVDDPETSWQVAVGHLIDVARALEAAHAAGLVHRDVKPENVMVREDGVVKVLDFGIARRSVSAIDPTAPTATATEGLIMGTASYMPPEQVRGEPLDGRCDEFAWAVMAFELFTGEHPWGHGGDAVRLMSTMLTKPPRRVSDLRPQLPRELSAIVARGLSPERDDRFPSMRAVVDELAAVLGEGDRGRAEPAVSARTATELAAASVAATSTTTGAASAPAVRRTSGKPARWIIPVALVGVAGAGLGVRAALSGASPRDAAPAADAKPTAASSFAPVGSAAPIGSAAATGSAAEPPPVKAPLRYRCHTDVQEHGVVSCGPASFQWCDVEGRKIACCADGLVASGHDGMCECPPLSNEAGRARGCVDSPKAKPFLPQDVAALLRAARTRVRACFDEGEGHERTSRLRFLVDFSPEGPTAAVRILRSDSPDPAKQACALRELRSLEGWAARGGAAAWEMDWDVGARTPALAAARAAAAAHGAEGYGYEYTVDPVKTTAPPLYQWPLGKGDRLMPEPIQNRMRRAFPAMSGCITASPDRSAGAAQRPGSSSGPFVGRIIPEFVIGEDGRVVDVQLDGSDISDATVVSCILAKVAKVEFPASHAGVITVVYPLAFGPGAAE